MPINHKYDNKNFIHKILKYEKICSIKNSMTILEDTFPIILNEMLRNKNGVLHLCNPGLISHDEIL